MLAELVAGWLMVVTIVTDGHILQTLGDITYPHQTDCQTDIALAKSTLNPEQPGNSIYFRCRRTDASDWE